VLVKQFRRVFTTTHGGRSSYFFVLLLFMKRCRSIITAFDLLRFHLRGITFVHDANDRMDNLFHLLLPSKKYLHKNAADLCANENSTPTTMLHTPQYEGENACTPTPLASAHCPGEQQNDRKARIG
jgi:hypothetical protein